jgi:hypothetical protein
VTKKDWLRVEKELNKFRVQLSYPLGQYEKNHFQSNRQVKREGAECALHPLIHTLLKFNLAQDMDL